MLKFEVTWTCSAKEVHGGVVFKMKKNEYPTLHSNLVEWGKQKIEKYIRDCEEGIIPSNDTPLSYYVKYLSGVNTDTVDVISVFRKITHRSEIDDLDDKAKEKIQKLLNLSMSQNENEAAIASSMAYKFMKKHSLTKEEVEGQEFLSFSMKPKGKRISSWEILIYSSVCEAAGVLFTYNKGNKGDGMTPTFEPRLSMLGRKRDVLNASYLIECYLREIDNLMKEKKQKSGFSTKEVNDYRVGLISGISSRLRKEEKSFFSGISEKFHNVVPVDVRIREASSLLFTKHEGLKLPKVTKKAFEDGKEDSKKIVIRKAAEDKQTNIKKIS